VRDKKPIAPKPIVAEDQTVSSMPPKTEPFRITPEMEEYIRSKSTDLRICTTCEGPILFPVKIAPPKATDYVQEVGEKKLYISAVQAPCIRVIDSRMLPKCALVNRHK
jgi:hypothetical protein